MLKRRHPCRCWNKRIFIFRLIYYIIQCCSITHRCFRALADWIQITSCNLLKCSIQMQTPLQNNHWSSPFFLWCPLWIFENVSMAGIGSSMAMSDGTTGWGKSSRWDCFDVSVASARFWALVPEGNGRLNEYLVPGLSAFLEGKHKFWSMTSCDNGWNRYLPTRR